MTGIDLYSFATPNGQKIGIALEEMKLEYRAHLINIGQGQQFSPEFLKINPNGKIPAIVDQDTPGGPLAIFESGAILVHLAERTGLFLPKDPRGRAAVMQWLFFQVGGIGPMFGQFGHFFKHAREKCDHPYPLERYTTEAKRLLGVLDQRLGQARYLAGDHYSIADMATIGWVNGLSVAYAADDVLGLKTFTSVHRWCAELLARPAVQKGMLVCKP